MLNISILRMKWEHLCSAPNIVSECVLSGCWQFFPLEMLLHSVADVLQHTSWTRTRKGKIEHHTHIVTGHGTCAVAFNPHKALVNETGTCFLAPFQRLPAPACWFFFDFGSSTSSTCNCISFQWQKHSSHLPLAAASLLFTMVTGGLKVTNGWDSGGAEQSSCWAKVIKALWFKWILGYGIKTWKSSSIQFFPREGNWMI